MYKYAVSYPDHPPAIIHCASTPSVTLPSLPSSGRVEEGTARKFTCLLAEWSSDNGTLPVFS